MSTERPICFITGVGPGTGTAIARRFAASGYRLVLNARNVERLADLAEELPEALALPGDLADSEARNAVIETLLAHGVPTVVINNAVGGTFGTFLEIDPADLSRNFAVNVEAVLPSRRCLWV